MAVSRRNHKFMRFYISLPHRCSYLPAQEAVSLFADPQAIMTTEFYSRLIDRGFRRSGSHVYRPQCPACCACIPTRIPVSRFKPSRSQRRNCRVNQDLTVSVLSSRYHDEHFKLYQRYINTRHTGGGMENPTPQAFRSFLRCQWAQTLFIEFRLEGKLLGIAVSDVLPQGLSAVYTFFDPDYSKRGLGTFGVLWQIAEARRRALDYVYLGYWIAENRKMRYKTDFRPIEGFVDGQWEDLAVIE